MKMTGFLVAIVLMITTACSKSSDGEGGVFTPSPPVDKGWEFESTPFWKDEFEYTGLPDPAKWGYDVGGHGWGNNELQYYTEEREENARVEDGKLVITAIRENIQGREYSSARIVSRGKGDFLYGRFEIRAKLPAGRGTWPAIWMLPTDWEYGNWPSSGEIDIMEHVGYDPNNVLMSVHTEAYNHMIGTQKSGGKNVPTAIDSFHVYRIDWTPYAIRGFIDGEQIFTFVNEGKGYKTWPFDKKFHLLMNLAVGGNWGGAQGIDETIFPARFEIDYVRVYRMIEQ
jgi:beta-glucanase (GH16 family)